MTSEHPNALLDRTTAGLNVQVAWLPIMQMGILQCSVEDRVLACSLEADQLLDAFEHPMIYLPKSSVDILFPPRAAAKDEGVVIDLSNADPTAV